MKSFDDTLVSVCMITYNHQSFIAKAIDGVMMQETNFRYELILSDDCSTDNTREICKLYHSKYPDKIKLLLPESNIGVIKNSLGTLRACTGKYIAICEGDDYWTDALKLQKQVDFMEANPEYGMVHTNYRVVDEFDNEINTYKRIPLAYIDKFDVFDLYMKRKYEVASLTALFRSDLFREFESELNTLQLKMTDLPMWLEFSKKSKIKYIDVVSSSYRLLKNSASHSSDVMKTLAFNLNMLEVFRYFSDKYNVHYNHKKILSKYYGNLIKVCYDNKNPQLAANFYMKMVALYFPSVFNPRPLLFFLGVKFTLFDLLIRKLKLSKFSGVKKHFV
jgi:glycosyltransferase involved in cell wall biosynthesis